MGKRPWLGLVFPNTSNTLFAFCAYFGSPDTWLRYLNSTCPLRRGGGGGGVALGMMGNERSKKYENKVFVTHKHTNWVLYARYTSRP